MNKFCIGIGLSLLLVGQLPGQTSAGRPERYGAPDKPVLRPPAFPPPATNAAALRAALVQRINQDWKTTRSVVEKTVAFEQTDEIRFGTMGGRANIHCTLKEGRALPEFFIVHLTRRGERLVWNDYRRTLVNLGGKVTDLTPKDCRVSVFGDGYLEQMSVVLTVADFRAMTRQEQIPVSVAGEEFVLTAHTLNKWRSLLAYFDQNQAAAEAKSEVRLPAVAK